MADTRFTALGMSGSGKTCFLLGMYYKMTGGLKGYTLSTDDDLDYTLRTAFDKMRDTNQSANRFPAPTDQTNQYYFDLNYEYNKILSFDWLDYPGGALDSKNNDIETYTEIKESIKNSSTLFIFVNGSLFIEEDDDNIDDVIDTVKDECAGKINHFLKQYLDENGKLPPVAIVITKYDLFKEKFEPEDIFKIISESFDSLFVKGKSKNKFVTIVPVSMGKNISEDNYSGKLKPININLPIFLGIYFSLQDVVLNKNSTLNSNFKKVSDLNNKISFSQCEIERQRNRFFGGNKKIINSENDNISKLKQSLSTEKYRISQLENEINQKSYYLDGLIEVLDEKLNLVFFNGEQVSFKEFDEEKYGN